MGPVPDRPRVASSRGAPGWRTVTGPAGKFGSWEGMLAAHLDTVFEAGTDVQVRQESQRWYGPGLGDNSSSLAVLTALLRDLDPARLQAPLLLAADVGEEGLGDLRGAKHLLARVPARAFVAVTADRSIPYDSSSSWRRSDSSGVTFRLFFAESMSERTGSE